MAKRFIWDEAAGSLKYTAVIVDSQTGVQYLFANYGNAGGLAPILDADGKPLLHALADTLED